MKVIIDRFEGNFAVVELEDKKMVRMPKELIPVGAKEGYVIKIEIDAADTKSREKKVQKLMDNIWE